MKSRSRINKSILKSKKMETIKKSILAMLLSVVAFAAQAQQASILQVNPIEPYRVEITKDKTTNIIFPLAIISVDRGIKDVLAQKAKGVENILQVKAANDSIKETNLTVVTSDGKLNSFILTYSRQPAILNFSLGKNPREGMIFLSPENTNEAEIEAYSRLSAASRKKIGGISEKDSGISFRLNGIYIHGNVMYFRIKIENSSNISYDIDQFRFYIRDEKRAKRTASQEIEVSPVYVHDRVEKITTENTMVVALPKFTVPDQKYLAIQLMEKNGGRHLELKINNKDLFRALPIK